MSEWINWKWRKKEVRKIIRTEIDDGQSIIDTEQNEIRVLKKALKKYDSDGVCNKVSSDYLSKITSFLYQLDVFTFEEKEFRDIAAYIKEIGSDRPRALLAYFYSILHIMMTYSSSTFCPIVIDSPNQQDHDKESL